MKPMIDKAGAQTAAGTGVQGLPAGTKVLTLDGELPVEFLAPGDRVITRDSGMATVRAVRVRAIRAEAVAVAAGSLGHDRPDADTILPATQQVLVRDWRARAIFGADRALVAVARLADGQYVRALGPREMRVVTLEFDREHVIYAGGLEVAAPAPAPVAA